MDKDPKVYLEHILESINFIDNYSLGKTLDAFLSSTKEQDAIIRRLEIIGEAVKKIPEDFKVKYSEIPWSKMAGMRDVLIHAYFVVDIRAVWQTIQDDLPELKKQITNILKQ